MYLYIPDFICGVIATLAAELLLIIICAIYIYKKGEGQ